MTGAVLPCKLDISIKKKSRRKLNDQRPTTNTNANTNTNADTNTNTNKPTAPNP